MIDAKVLTIKRIYFVKQILKCSNLLNLFNDRTDNLLFFLSAFLNASIFIFYKYIQ